MSSGVLEKLTPGMAIPFGGNRLAIVPEELAARFKAGDRLVVVDRTGELLHVPAEVQAIASAAVGRAHAAFHRMGEVSDEAITAFFAAFAERLGDDGAWARIAEANAADVAAARARGRSTTRLAVSDAMRRDMISGLLGWKDAPGGRGRAVERIEHPGWAVEQVTGPLGVVGFVFEGRPNVFADATGVLRGGTPRCCRL